MFFYVFCIDQTHPSSQQEVGRRQWGTELHGLWKRLFGDSEKGRCVLRWVCGDFLLSVVFKLLDGILKLQKMAWIVLWYSGHLRIQLLLVVP